MLLHGTVMIITDVTSNEINDCYEINTHILGLLVVVGLFSLQSCDDESYDIEGSNQNYVYINVNRWTSTEYSQIHLSMKC